MRDRGRPRSLVALAGDIAAGDAPPGEPGWRVALEGERSGAGYGVVLLSNAAVSTSGDTEQFVEIEGRRYSHIIDPATGVGMTERRAVSVVAPSAELSDPLATAACLMGPAKSRGMLARYPGSAAVFEEQTEIGLRRAEIDPERVLRWAASGEPNGNR